MSELKIRRKAIARVKNLLPVPVKYRFCGGNVRIGTDVWCDVKRIVVGVISSISLVSRRERTCLAINWSYHGTGG